MVDIILGQFLFSPELPRSSQEPNEPAALGDDGRLLNDEYLAAAHVHATRQLTSLRSIALAANLCLGTT